MSIITISSSTWYSTTDRPSGFGFTLPSRERIQELQAEFFGIVGSWTRSQVLTTMGVLNAYLYRAAIDTGCLKKEDRRHRVTNRLKAIAQSGVECFNLTQQAICTYLKEHWPGASGGKTTIWRFRDILADTFGLFQYKRQSFRAGDKKRGTAPDIENFDLVRALILYEYLEGFYLERWQNQLEDLPKHRGAIARLLFNAIFEGLTRFRRKTQTSPNPVPDFNTVPVYWQDGVTLNIFGEVVPQPEEESWKNFPDRHWEVGFDVGNFRET